MAEDTTSSRALSAGGRSVFGRLLRPRRGRRERAQSLVEFALTLPILMILVFGIIDFANGLRAYVELANGVREGARYGAVGNPLGGPLSTCSGVPNTTVVGKVCAALGNLKKANMTNLTATCNPSCAPGNSVVVNANYRYDYITPIGDFMHFFTGGVLQTSLTLSSSATMRLE